MRERAEAMAWRIVDETGRLRRYYRDGLHRVERLQRKIGEQLQGERDPNTISVGWDILARLAPISSFFFGTWNFFFDAPADVLTRAVVAPADERRRMIFGGFA